MKSVKYNPLTSLVVAVALAIGLAGCGGSSDEMPDPPPPPTSYEMAMDAIAMAGTAEAAQAAYDAVKDDVTAAEGDRLQAAVDARVEVLATAMRAAMQMEALSDAADMIDTSAEALSTQAGVDAARAAIAGLRQAIDDADDVDDTSMYMSRLSAAEDAVDMAQGGLDTATRRTNQMTALMGASETLQAALAALSGSTPTQAQLDAANAALTALNGALAGAMDLTGTEKAPYQREADNAAAPIATAQTAFDDAGDEADRQAAAAMAATAAKLYAGISAQMGAGDGTTFAATDRDAFYNSDATAILVSIGDGENVPAGIAATLSEDKMTMVADNHGWAGKRYADPAGGDSYEAVVYSNVEAPRQGRKFGSAATVTATGAYEYQLTDGALTTTQLTADGAAMRVALPSVTRTAGTETFELPDPNPNAATVITVPGSFHGVSGTYRCTPGGTPCTAAVAQGGGFTLAGGTTTWTFMPSNAEARVMSAADVDYASYGWWLMKTANDQTYTASAFVDERGTVAAASNLDALNGTATYVGGAAGKYALASSTGGTNDAGHFTARAMLEADFDGTADTADAITGTIDQFMGADGMSRNWSVKLNGSTISDAGAIGVAMEGTEWTIDGMAAADSGSWSGALRDNGTDGVPQVATGTFHTEYGTAGKMVGAFGANKQ